MHLRYFIYVVWGPWGGVDPYGVDLIHLDLILLLYVRGYLMGIGTYFYFILFYFRERLA